MGVLGALNIRGEYAAEIAAAGAIPPLVAMHGSLSVRAQGFAVGAIGSIAGSEADAVAAAGAAPLLVALLQ